MEVRELEPYRVIKAKQPPNGWNRWNTGSELEDLRVNLRKWSSCRCIKSSQNAASPGGKNCAAAINTTVNRENWNSEDRRRSANRDKKGEAADENESAEADRLLSEISLAIYFGLQRTTSKSSLAEKELAWRLDVESVVIIFAFFVVVCVIVASRDPKSQRTSGL